MQAIGRQPNPPIRAPDGALIHYERHRPEQTVLYRLVQQHAATFFEQADSAVGADLPQFVKDEFDAFLECDILAHGFRFPLADSRLPGIDPCTHLIEVLRRVGQHPDARVAELTSGDALIALSKRPAAAHRPHRT